MKPSNFNQLKNYLQVGMELILVDTNMPNHKYLNTTRKIARKQTNAIKFEGGSWLYMTRAGEFSFQENGFTQTFDKGTPYMGFLTYEYK